MTSNNIIFIDTNMYLDLFTLVNGTIVKKVLEPLITLKNDIFITRQIVDEINRNKLQKASELLGAQIKYLALNDFTFPDHLLSDAETEELRKELSTLRKGITKLRDSRQKNAMAILKKISLSEDEISKKLETLFTLARVESSEEVAAARTRKERGNPPGKKADPLGDELSWEQLLAYCKKEKKKKLWLITRDQDFYTIFEREIFLNPILHRELKKLGIEVYCFQDLLEGLENFSSKTGKLKGKLPSEKQAETIRKAITEGLTLRDYSNDLFGQADGGLSSLERASRGITATSRLSEIFSGRSGLADYFEGQPDARKAMTEALSTNRFAGLFQKNTLADYFEGQPDARKAIAEALSTNRFAGLSSKNTLADYFEGQPDVRKAIAETFSTNRFADVARGTSAKKITAPKPNKKDDD